MSNDTVSKASELSSLKDKLFSEFEKMSQLMQQEKTTFEEEMIRRKNELESSIKSNLAELAAGREQLENTRSELRDKEKYFNEQIKKKDVTIKRLQDELEQKRQVNAQRIKDDQQKTESRAADKLADIQQRTKELEKRNNELMRQKLSLEVDLNNLQQAHKKEEEKHLQKIAAMKNELDELKDEIEQKLFMMPETKKKDLTKKTRELVIKTITGDTYRGKINIGKKDRLSDMFTQVKIPFIVIYDAKYKGEDQSTVIINKQNIVSIKPLD